MLLQVVADARDVGRDFHLVRQPHARDLAQRRVRLLGRHGAHLKADATLLRGARDGLLALLEAVPVLAHGRRLDLGDLALAAVAHELGDGRHGDAAPFGPCSVVEWPQWAPSKRDADPGRWRSTVPPAAAEEPPRSRRRARSIAQARLAASELVQRGCRRGTAPGRRAPSTCAGHENRAPEPALAQSKRARLAARRLIERRRDYRSSRPRGTARSATAASPPSRPQLLGVRCAACRRLTGTG